MDADWRHLMLLQFMQKNGDNHTKEGIVTSHVALEVRTGQPRVEHMHLLSSALTEKGSGMLVESGAINCHHFVNCKNRL